jgi:transposase InsO family protein
VRKNTVFEWDERRQKSMDMLKEAICRAPALRPLDYQSPLEVVLAVDTSQIAVGYILSQQDENGRRRVARYGSLPMNERESRYSQPKLELYGLFRALRNFRLFLIGVKNLVVEMDAKFIKGMINQPDVQPNATMNRWIYGILLFDFVLRHVPATTHQGPDGLSRRPQAPDDSDTDNAEAADEWLESKLDFRIHAEAQQDQTNNAPTMSTFSIMDSELGSIQHFLQTLETPIFRSTAEKSAFLNKAKKFLVKDGKLWRRSKYGDLRVIFNASNRNSLLEQAHDKLGHRGVYGIVYTLTRRFWWPTLAQDIRHFVKTCHQCQVRSTKKVVNPLSVSTPATIFTRIYLDIMLMPQITRKGARYIVAARDDLSGAAVGRKLVKATAQAVANFLWEEVICQYGYIGSITTDNGPETKGAFEELVRRHNIPHIRIMPYNSKANGVVERGHFTIREALVKACKGNIGKWPKLVNEAFFADRVTTRKATGFSPFYMLYGVDPVLPFDLAEATYLVSGFTSNMSSEDLLALRIRQLSKRPEDMAKAASTIAKSRYRSKAQFEKRFGRRLSNRVYKEGDLVLVRNSRVELELSRKTEKRYNGPFEIIRQTKGGSYVVKELDGTAMRKGIAPWRLIPYYSREGRPIDPDDIMEDSSDEESSEDSDSTDEESD